MKNSIYILLPGIAFVFVFSSCADPVDPLIELRNERSRLAKIPRRLIMNNDGCDALYFPRKDIVTPENFLKLRTSNLSGKQVDALFYCSLSSGFGQFTHDTKVAALLENPPPSEGYGADKRNISRDLVNKGTDPVRIVNEFAHKTGMEFFWSMRMNDTHDVAHTPDKPYFLFPQLKKDHPEWLISDHIKRTTHGRWSSVNYALPEIRDLAFRYIEEVCQNYDVDGIEMDFFRHLTYFPSVANGGKASEEEREMFNELMRRIRTMSEVEGLKRKRPILLAIRIPDSVGFCRDMGFDIEKWLNEGLVDIFIPSGYFRLQHWEETISLGHKHGVQVIPCLSDPRVKGETRFKRRSVEGYRGRAANAWAAGADGLEIYNQFDPDWPMWNELGSAESLKNKDKLYFVTPMDGTADSWMANGEAHRKMPRLSPKYPEFLEPGKHFVTEIVLAEDVNQKMEAELHFDLPTVIDTKRLEVRINDKLLKNGKVKKRWIDYPLFGDHLNKGINKIDILLLPGKSSETDEGWTVVYNEDAKPGYPWVTDPRDQPKAVEVSVKDGAVLISDKGKIPGDYYYYRYNWGADSTHKNVVEARVKVLSDDSYLIFGNGRSGERLRLSPGEIGLHHYKNVKLAMDTTTDFHTYRLEMQNDDLLIYVDGKLALDAKGKFAPRKGYRNKIAFGAANSTEIGAALWDFVKVRTINAGQALKDIAISVNYPKPKN